MRRLLFGLVLRIAKGERYESIEPLELRCQLAVFAFIPIFLLTLYFGHPLWYGASTFALGVYVLGAVLVACAAVIGWAMFVPVTLSKIASIALWIFVIWIVWHLDFMSFRA
jgi:hypothetical protein